MLKKILSPKTCADCRICCKFDCTDTWELPVISDETAARVKELCPETEFIITGNELTFKSPNLHGDELFQCPALTENGCGLKAEDKPFDCKIWPFRIMRDENESIVITVSELCIGMKNFSADYLRKFLIEENLDTLIFDYAASYPSHIKPMQEGYKPLLKKI